MSDDDIPRLDLGTYQRYAIETDQLGVDNEHAVTTFLHNLSDAVTSVARLHTERRDDESDPEWREDAIKERLGDVLWYIAAISGRLDVSLEDVAARNIDKARQEWGQPPDDEISFDDELPEDEQLPRRMALKFRQVVEGGKTQVVVTTPLRDGGDIQLGDRITDNDYGDDGYRFHDCLHLAYAAILGWSPVVRALLRRKRKSVGRLDEVEDGARAILVEEALTAFIREHAKREKLFEKTLRLSYPIFREIKTQVKRLEVRKRSFALWERAVLDGYGVYRSLCQHQGGIVEIDLKERKIEFRPL